MSKIQSGYRPAANLTNAGKGRPKGAQNKTTTMAKAAIAEAFDRMGGTDALVKWAMSSEDATKAFYATIYPKLLPLQVTGGDNGEPPLNIMVGFVEPS